MKPPRRGAKWVELEGAHKGWATTKRRRATHAQATAERGQGRRRQAAYAAWLAGCIDGLAAASDVEINLMTCESVHTQIVATFDADSLVVHRCEFVVSRGSSKSSRTTSRRQVGLRRVLWRRGVARGQCAEIQTSEMRKLRGAWAAVWTSEWARRRRSPSPRRVAHGVDVGRGLDYLVVVGSAALKRDGSGASWGRVLQEDAGCAVVSRAHR